jgi:hypothetical protein
VTTYDFDPAFDDDLTTDGDAYAVAAVAAAVLALTAAALLALLSGVVRLTRKGK